MNREVRLLIMEQLGISALNVSPSLLEIVGLDGQLLLDDAEMPDHGVCAAVVQQGDITFTVEGPPGNRSEAYVIAMSKLDRIAHVFQQIGSHYGIEGQLQTDQQKVEDFSPEKTYHVEWSFSKNDQRHIFAESTAKGDRPAVETLEDEFKYYLARVSTFELKVEVVADKYRGVDSSEMIRAPYGGTLGSRDIQRADGNLTQDRLRFNVSGPEDRGRSYTMEVEESTKIGDLFDRIAPKYGLDGNDIHTSKEHTKGYYVTVQTLVAKRGSSLQKGRIFGATPCDKNETVGNWRRLEDMSYHWQFGLKVERMKSA